MGAFLHEILYHLRSLARRPGFTAAAVVTLGLGLGANTVIFSLVEGVLLAPLPYPEPDRLVKVWQDNRRQDEPESLTSNPNFVDWREQNQVFEDMAGFFPPYNFNVSADDAEPESVLATAVVGNFFQVLGVEPTMGRVFEPEDEERLVIILGHDLWQRHFGGDRGVIGRELDFARNRAVVGVMPPGFDYPPGVEVWIPLVLRGAWRDERQFALLEVVGRLRDDVGLGAAQAEMDTIARRLEELYPQTNEDFGVRVVSMHDEVVQKVRPAIYALFGAIVFVLAIACANVAGLLLARASARRRETAVKVALGASRGAVLRQFLLESLLYALLGTALGLGLAVLGLRVLKILSPGNVPRLEEVSLDAGAFLFTLALALATGFACGLAPALQASSSGLADFLKEGGRGGAAGRRSGRTRRALVVAEIALALVLLIGAGLLIRSFRHLQAIDPGFRSEGLVTSYVSLPGARYRGEARTQFFRDVLERLRAQPGVEAAGAASGFLREYSPPSDYYFDIEGRAPFEPRERVRVLLDSVTPGFFETIGLPLVEGRYFTDGDGTEENPVVIVNETMARRFWPDESPLGRRFRHNRRDLEEMPPFMTIVGVVADSRRSGFDEPVRPATYIPYAQGPTAAMVVMARTQGDPAALSGPLRDVVHGLDPRQAVSKVATVEAVLGERLAGRRFSMFLLGVFSAVALVLATVGIYGVVSYTVAQSTREIGLRMALGARQGDVLRSTLAQGGRLALTGVAVGLAVAAVLTRWLGSLLSGVSATDPLTFGVFAVLLSLVALLASFVPARAAARVDPIVALRDE